MLSAGRVQGATCLSKWPGYGRAPGKAAPRSHNQAEMGRMAEVSEVDNMGTGAVGVTPGRRIHCEKILERPVFLFVKGR